MFARFFFGLRAAKIPTTLREYLTLIEAIKAGAAETDVEKFYFLARAALVKDECFIDRFDRVFAESFKGLEAVAGPDPKAEARELPLEWLKKYAEKYLTAAEKAQVKSLGGWEELMKTLEQRLKEQQGRHQGGSKWIGTAGTSPFGAYGYNPEGVRIGQDKSRHRRAVKVWDKREFRNLDDQRVLGVRSIKIALRRLRRWARQGAADELDLDETIRSTAAKGWLDIQTRPERRNAVNVLLFMDVGGSMDDHVRLAEEVFTAARAAFKSLEYFYFHNCLYEGVWKDNRRRWTEQTPTDTLFNTFSAAYVAIFVGDASMSPYEIAYPGGAVEHWNAEAGEVWLRRAFTHWPKSVWLNPVAERSWQYTHSIGMIQQLIDNRMFPMTLEGLDRAMRAVN